MPRVQLVDVDKWQEIFATMRRNRLRTFMTAFGVFWGILVLVIMLAFGTALESGIAQSVRGFGSSQIYIWGGRSTLPYQGLRSGRRTKYYTEDIPVINEVEGVDLVAPRTSLGGYRSANNISHAGKTGAFKVVGDYPAWGIIQPFEYYEGRFVNEIDIRDRRKVAVIGEQVYKTLFTDGKPALGESILIQGVYFQIIGRVHSSRSGGAAEEDAATVYIPFTTFQHAFHQGNRIGWFAITALDGYSSVEVEENVRSALRTRKKVHPEDAQAIQGYNAAERSEKVRRLFTGIRIFMWFVGLATLLAGMLGVSNIMLIVVRERTKEIGVRKALGATPASIITHIVHESVIITLLAGVVGLVTGVGLSELIAVFMEGSDLPLGQPVADFEVSVAATLILVVAGAIAGFLPARHAARIQPVDALRT